MTARIDPLINSNTREARIVAAFRRELEDRLGPSPSFVLRQIAEQLVRTRLAIALLERKRADAGPLNEFDAEMLGRQENSLSRGLLKIERWTAQTKPDGKSALTTYLASKRDQAA
jgi:hypothetical protein